MCVWSVLPPQKHHAGSSELMVHGVPGWNMPGRHMSCARGLTGVKARTPPALGTSGKCLGVPASPFYALLPANL